MLRFAEEIVLLLLDEERGALISSLQLHSLDIILAGAVLMDLALEGRIDTDLTQLSVVDSTPLDDNLLDPTLADIAQSAETRAISFWLARIAERGGRNPRSDDHSPHHARYSRSRGRRPDLLDTSGVTLAPLSEH